MGGVDVAAGEAVLTRAGVPAFADPDTAARVFTLMWRHSWVLRGLYETPSLALDTDGAQSPRERIEALIQSVRASGRTLLTEVESKQALATYGIPVVETRVALTEDAAVECAADIGFPVVLKLYSETITHKTEVGGVQLNLQDEAAVRQAYQRIVSAVSSKAGAEHVRGVTVQPMVALDGFELIVGSSVDAQFGPVVLFGSGGHLVDVYADRALALPPLNTTLALRMMEQTRICKAFKGVPGRQPIDVASLAAVLVRFSQLIVEQPWIREIDINPLLASADRTVALDARIVLHDLAVPAERLPAPAIRPYPSQYIGSWALGDGRRITFRPIRPEDEPLMVKFHGLLSDRSVYFRYFNVLKLTQRVSHERLTRICFIDYDREMALVAEFRDPETSERQILGVGRLTKLHGAREGEFAVIVADDYQRLGIGGELLRRVRDVAKAERLTRITGDVLSENLEMIRLCESHGFASSTKPDDPQVVRVSLEFEPEPSAS